MKVDSADLSEQDILNIKDAVQQRHPIDFCCYTLTPEQKTRFLQILKIFLDECQQEHLFNCLSYCLLELLDNASKANAKRIYFQEKNLNIDNAEDYQDGMKSFKANLSDNSKHYIEELRSGMLEVHLLLSLDNVISLRVSNNTKITQAEYQRIQEKIAKTRNYVSLEDAFGDIDQTEGSGLGIISIVLMLKKLGLDTDNLKFAVTDKETVATIEIPADSFCDLDMIEPI